MFDLICIFTKGGIVVWSKFFCSAGLDLVNILVKNVLMEEKTAQSQFIYQNYIFKWRLENQSGLVFAVIYQEVLQLMLVDEFIDMLRDDYMAKAYSKIVFKDGFLEVLPEYNEEANAILQKWQDQKMTNDGSPQMRTFGDTKRGQKVVEDQKKREESDKKSMDKKRRKLEEQRKAEEAKKLEADKKEEEARLLKAEDEKKAKEKADADLVDKEKAEFEKMQKEKEE